MPTNYKKEIAIIGIALLPTIYLAYMWNSLPARVPMHFNINGEVDRYGSKIELLLLTMLLPLVTYFIVSVVSKVDPKVKQQNMSHTISQLKLWLTVFMSVLAIYIIYSVQQQSLGNLNFIELCIGVLYIVLGKYFKQIKPNYFIGIRTPCTLESNTNWQATHQLASKLWIVGGATIVLLSLILSAKINIIFFLSITAVLVVVPIVKSYIIYQKTKQ